jgi:hypothetical protein
VKRRPRANDNILAELKCLEHDLLLFNRSPANSHLHHHHYLQRLLFFLETTPIDTAALRLLQQISQMFCDLSEQRAVPELQRQGRRGRPPETLKAELRFEIALLLAARSRINERNQLGPQLYQELEDEIGFLKSPMTRVPKRRPWAVIEGWQTAFELSGKNDTPRLRQMKRAFRHDVEDLEQGWRQASDKDKFLTDQLRFIRDEVRALIQETKN